MAEVGRLRTEVVLRVADSLWSCFIVTPLAIFYWGGTWKLLDLYLFPNDAVLSATVSLTVGVTACLAAYLILPLLGDCMHQPALQTTCSSVGSVLCSRSCLYLVAFSVLNYWRGVWNLMDQYVGTGITNNAICVAVCVALLVPLRATVNTLASPYFVELDTEPDIYYPSTRFNVRASRFWCYLADSAFSLLVIGHLAAQLWRALWNLMDNYILPGDTLMSYYVSLGSGLGLTFILLLLQYPFSQIGQRLLERHWVMMLAFQQLVNAASVAGTLSVWRGGWGLNKDFLLDSTLDASLAHVLGTVGLMVTQTMATVSTLHVGIDAAGPSTTDFSYGIHYFLKLWRRRQTRREPGEIQARDDVGRAPLVEQHEDEVRSSSNHLIQGDDA